MQSIRDPKDAWKRCGSHMIRMNSKELLSLTARGKVEKSSLHALLPVDCTIEHSTQPFYTAVSTSKKISCPTEGEAGTWVMYIFNVYRPWLIEVPIWVIQFCSCYQSSSLVSLLLVCVLHSVAIFWGPAMIYTLMSNLKEEYVMMVWERHATRRNG